MANGNSHNAIDDLIILNELQQYAQPYTTGVAQSFPSEQEFKMNRLSSIIEREGSIQPGPQYVEAGVPSWLVDITTGGASKGVSILKRLLGGMKSRKKFPVGYGQVTKPAQTAADDAVKILEDFKSKAPTPKPYINPLHDKIAKLDKSTREKLSKAGLSATLPEKKFHWSKEQWQTFSNITDIPLEELTGKVVPWTEPLW